MNPYSKVKQTYFNFTQEPLKTVEQKENEGRVVIKTDAFGEGRSVTLMIGEDPDIVSRAKLVWGGRRLLEEALVNPQKSASTIQHCFRAFAQRKREKVVSMSLAAVERRKIEYPKELPLSSGEVSFSTTEKVGPTLEKLKAWARTIFRLRSEISSEDEAAVELIQRNETIGILLRNSLQELSEDQEKARKSSFKAVCDTEGNMQALALFKVDEERSIVREGREETYNLPLYVSYIGTAPWNLRIQRTEDDKGDKRRVEGAGTALIESAIYESIKKGYKGAVALEATSSAIAFYEKLGFKKCGWSPSEEGLTAMELSVQDAKNLLDSTRSGRARPTS